jgi:hypothetical protein
MIHVDFFTAISAYMGLILISLVGISLWIELNSRGRSPKRFGAAQKKWKCHYCGYVYLGTSEESISQCPRCESYNKA